MLLTGKGYLVHLPVRILQNLITIPVSVICIWLVATGSLLLCQKTSVSLSRHFGKSIRPLQGRSKPIKRLMVTGYVLDHFRSALAQTVDQGVFFDNASMGPVIPAVTEAICDCMRLRQSMPMKYYQYANEIFPACKTRLASLINASPEEIAFTENVAYGINCAAGSIPFSPGDNVIVCDREFSSNIYPWMVQEHQKGVHLRIIPAAISGLDTFQKLPSHHPDFFPGGGLTVALLERYADSRTRAVSLSSVEFCDGFSADLEAIGQWSRQRNIYLIVDCAQSLGVMPMDVKKYHIDFLAGLSSKWLLGPFSTGFLYVRKDCSPPFSLPLPVQTASPWM